MTKRGSKSYELNSADKLFITVLPTKNAESTHFEFEYQVVDINFFEAFYLEYFTGKDG